VVIEYAVGGKMWNGEGVNAGLGHYFLIQVKTLGFVKQQNEHFRI
jgi:hypothetical protein